ncbi:MAG: Uncharacterized protein AUREO_059000 [Aureobasidium pullulans]|nr:MAG: Uncharacterized protein AUREO_059000 [Aureobasidium pullulans]
MSERDALSSRAIPFMELSDGSAASLTAPPPPLPHYLNAEGRAMARFAVEGNAVITGGAGTLALAAARALLEHGLANLYLFDLPSTLQSSAQAILSLQTDFPSSTISTAPVDVTDATLVSSAFSSAAAAMGSLDILLCFAGIVGCIHAIEMTADQWRKVIDINTTGSFLCAQAAAKQMQSQNTGGTIVFTASISGRRVNFPQPQSAYNVSKAAVVAMKDSLAAEWARFGIRVNSISPGRNSVNPLPAVTTELQDQISNVFWRIFDTSMHELATGTYKIVWADEEEMEMNAGVPLLERAVAFGRICEGLWSAIMIVWNSGQNVR